MTLLPEVNNNDILARIKEDFITSDSSFRALAKKYGLRNIPISKIEKKIWLAERAELWEETIRRKHYGDSKLYSNTVRKARNFVKQITDNISALLNATYAKDERTGMLQVKYPLHPSLLNLISDTIAANLELSQMLDKEDTNRGLADSMMRTGMNNEKIITILEGIHTAEENHAGVVDTAEKIVTSQEFFDSTKQWPIVKKNT